MEKITNNFTSTNFSNYAINKTNTQKNKKGNKEIIKRIFTATILIFILAIILFFGASSLNLYGFILFSVVDQKIFGFIYLFIGIFGLLFVLLEYFKVFFNKDKIYIYCFLLISSLLLNYGPTFLYWLDYLGFYHLKYIEITHIFGWLELSGILLSIIILAITNVFYLKNKSIGVLISFYIPFYLITFFFLFFNFLLILHSWTTIIILWIPVIFNDSLAYFGGRKWGKHKLAPKISPKKTWEGFITGLFGSISSILVIGALYLLNKNETKNISGFLVKNNNIQGNIFGVTYFDDTKYSYNYVYFLVLICFGLIIGIIGTLGDLCFSYFKRQNKIKDFSNLLPGHGGFLDRIDSIIFVVIFFGIYDFISSGINNMVCPLFPYLYH